MQEIIALQIYNPIAEENGWETTQPLSWHWHNVGNTTFPCTIVGFTTQQNTKFENYGEDQCYLIMESIEFLPYTKDYLPPGWNGNNWRHNDDFKQWL